MAVRRTPRFYFSLRSPYSWLAYRDLLERYPTLANELDWVPFWEPDELSRRLLAEAGGEFVYTAMSRAKHLYVLSDMRRLAADRELEFSWPVDREPCWEIPHLAYLVACRHGAGPEYVAHAYRARWQEGRNICDRATVARIGDALGLDADELASASDDPEVRREGVEALLAIYRDGVFGVPFFVHGFEKFWGVDRLPAFAASVPLPVRADAGPLPVGAPGRTDEGHAGGCG
ncbi:2-hydroxychromene-2-carboxylate isomerase [Plantactinospora soyae]|uniref:2-hydroxychromene-2-carboxylate isomerase n=1 Tax=Plantactinospora soyae TaxID=1544732 RepID=A0A927MC27_9ACTN|nr:DsbA family protein [Plantactinospora soyae]MBE1491988.1 2-hydroxychromene-2-carboxylate isomerase [Plantactinospora soyae]